MLKKRTFALVILLLITVPVWAAVSSLVQTIPGANLANVNGAIAGCSTLLAMPASIVAGTNGFQYVTCPSNLPAVFLGGDETPVFILSTGYDAIGIFLHGAGGQTTCNFSYNVVPGLNATQTMNGKNLASTSPITFSSTPSTGQLLSSGYDYCLHYANPLTAVAGFTIAWNP